MERLGFNGESEYQATEASYHIARYSIVRNFCANRRVLDIACGEGYGSYLMGAEWGASSVLGVDISEAAIESAKANFVAPNVTFEVGSCYDLKKHADAGKFDLIVSLETIEHLEDPVSFLTELKEISSKDANIIISCPNDPMLYEGDSVGNPFHLRRYTSEEFFSLVESFLGPCTSKIIGTPVAGTGNFLVNSESLRIGINQTSILSGTLHYDGPVVQVPPDEHIDLKRATYYIGIWGPADAKSITDLVTFYPTDIKSPAQERLRQDVGMLSDQTIALKTKVWELERENAQFRKEVTRLATENRDAQPETAALRGRIRHQTLRNHALTAENALMREAVRDLKASNADLSLKVAGLPGFQIAIYRRVRAVVPDRAVRVAKRILARLKR